MQPFKTAAALIIVAISLALGACASTGSSSQILDDRDGPFTKGHK